MKLVYVDFMSDLELTRVDSDAVPPDHARVVLRDEEGWRTVMSSEWRVVPHPIAPNFREYSAHEVRIYLTERRGA